MKAPALLPAMLDLEAFHNACEVPVLDTPTIPDNDRYVLRLKLLSEEFIELVEGFEKRDLDNIAQELTDLIYVAIGTALEFGIPLHHVWDAIHAANMAKVDPVTGKVLYREDGKILKPEGWQKADINKALYG